MVCKQTHREQKSYICVTIDVVKKVFTDEYLIFLIL